VIASERGAGELPWTRQRRAAVVFAGSDLRPSAPTWADPVDASPAQNFVARIACANASFATLPHARCEFRAGACALSRIAVLSAELTKR